MAGTSYSIDLEVKSEGLQSASELLDVYAKRLVTASDTAARASAAVRAGEKDYARAETAYDRATKSLEKVNLAMADASGDKLAKLQKRQEAAAAAVASAKTSLDEQTAALDALSVASVTAANDLISLKEAQIDAKSAAAAAAADSKAAAAASLAAERAAAKEKELIAREAASSAAAESKASLAAERAAAKEKELIAREAASSAAAESKAALAAEKLAAREREFVAKEAASAAVSAAKEEQNALLDIEREKARAASAASELNEKASSALGQIGGPVGVLGQKVFGLRTAWDKLGKVLGGSGAYVAAAVGVAAVAAAVAALAVSAIAGAISFGRWAVSLADASRSQELLYAGILQSTEGAAELSSVVGDLASRVPQSTEKLNGMAATLAKSGLRGKALTDELERVAVAAAQVEFGPEWQRQMTSIEQQQKRLTAGIANIFGGLKIEKLLTGLSSLTELFDTNIASGAAIKTVFESLFQPAIDGVTGLIPRVRTAFLQFEILALKALIAIKPFGSTLLTIGKYVLIASAAIAGVLAVAVGGLVAIMAASAVQIGLQVELLISVARWLIGAGNAFVQFGATVLGAIKSFDLIGAGIDLMKGFATGITAGVGLVVDSVKSAAGGAVDAAKRSLGIASPSKVFAEIGMFTAEGMSQGLDSGASEVASSASAIVAPPVVAGAPTGQPAAPTSSGSTYQITINAAGGAAQDIADAVRQVILDVTNGAAIQVGSATT